ncbi:unnamed protein product [Chrysoparadoxa australica]
MVSFGGAEMSSVGSNIAAVQQSASLSAGSPRRVERSAAGQQEVEGWVIDSGASFHMSPSAAGMSGYRKCTSGEYIVRGAFRSVEASGVGGLILQVGEGGQLILEKVLHIPELHHHLLAQDLLTAEGSGITVTNPQGAKGEKLLQAQPCGLSGGVAFKSVCPKRGDNLNVLCVTRPAATFGAAGVAGQGGSVSKGAEYAARELHQMLGHVGDARMRLTAKQHGATVKGSIGHCLPCLGGKAQERSVPAERGDEKSSVRGGRLYWDISGPFRHPTLSGKRYVAVAVDDATRFSFMYLLTSRSDTVHCLEELHAECKAAGVTVRKLRCDPAGENPGPAGSSAVNAFMRRVGWSWELTGTRTPQRNGVAERRLAVIKQKARIMADASGLGASLVMKLWGTLLRTANHLVNLAATTGNEGGSPPWRRWHGRLPALKWLVPVGTLGIMLIPKMKRNPTGPQGEEVLMIGYGAALSTGSMPNDTYAVWNDRTERLLHTRHVKWERSVRWVDAAGRAGEAHRQDESEVTEFAELEELADEHAVAEEEDSELQYADDIGQQVLPEGHQGEMAEQLESADNHEADYGGLQDAFYSDADSSGEYSVGNSSEGDIADNFSEAPSSSVSWSDIAESEDDWSGQAPEVGSTVRELGHFLAPGRAGLQAHEVPSELLVPERMSTRAQVQARAAQDPSDAAATDSETEAEDELQTAAEALVAAMTVAGDPVSILDAQRRADWPEWQAALEVELQSWEDMGVKTSITSSEVPPGVRVLSTKAILQTKRGAYGEVLKLKARIVVRGFEQERGKDYTFSYAPTATFASVRMVFAFAAVREWELLQWDAVTAFLHGALDEPVYVKPPKGVGTPGEIWKLHKAAYGLCNAPAVWNKHFARVFTELGFVRSEVDPNIFLWFANTGEGELRLVLANWVHDYLGAYDPAFAEELSELKEQLSSRLKMKFMGEPSQFLGWAVTKTGSSIRLNQENAIKELVSSMEAKEGKLLRVQLTPAAPGTRLAKRKPSEEVCNSHSDYRAAVGSLLYIAMSTRPDIASAVREVAVAMQDPGVLHWEAVKRIVGYLKGTADKGLRYTASEDPELMLYVDAAYATDPEKARSVSGFAALLGGGAVCWFSRLQKLTAQSSCEAELIAMAEGTKEVLYLIQLLDDFGADVRPVRAMCDAQSAMFVATNRGLHRRVKHLEVRYHLTRHCVERGDIELDYCPTGLQAADGLTKSLGWSIFDTHRTTLLGEPIEGETAVGCLAVGSAAPVTTAVELCCGIGGFMDGLLMVRPDIEVKFAVDRDAGALGVFSVRHPSIAAVQEDIHSARILQMCKESKPDLIFGGPPCSDWSINGKQTEGQAADVTRAFVDIVVAVRPRLVVSENVTQYGESSTFEQVSSTLERAGYAHMFLVVSGHTAGLATQRVRLFLVAVRSDEPLALEKMERAVEIAADLEAHAGSVSIASILGGDENDCWFFAGMGRVNEIDPAAIKMAKTQLLPSWHGIWARHQSGYRKLDWRFHLLRTC